MPPCLGTGAVEKTVRDGCGETASHILRQPAMNESQTTGHQLLELGGDLLFVNGDSGLGSIEGRSMLW